MLCTIQHVKLIILKDVCIISRFCLWVSQAYSILRFSNSSAVLTRYEHTLTLGSVGLPNKVTKSICHLKSYMFSYKSVKMCWRTFMYLCTFLDNHGQDSFQKWKGLKILSLNLENVI